MKIFNNLSLRNRLTSFFFGIAVITIIVFAELLMSYFQSGLEDSARLRVMTESEAFAIAYKKDQTIDLPSTYVTSFSLDTLPVVDIRGTNILDNVEMSDGEFLIIEASEFLTDGQEYDPILVIYRLRLFDGRPLYTIARYDYELVEENANQLFDGRLYVILIIVASYLLLTILVLWYYNYKVGKRTGQLVNWAEAISSEFSETKPDFKFDEYNRLAACLQDALRRNAHLVEREKKFLSHASHELRTPIAIVRANLDILDKIALPEEAEVPVSRIQRANRNMQQITETLLWLARKSESQPKTHRISLPDLLTQVIDEQEYLLQGESVEVRTHFSDRAERSLPVIPLMIVLGNLVRNAFQYTHNGWVNIEFDGDSVTIENSELESLGEEYDVSFGFGLELTEKVCDKLGWQFDIQPREGGVIARLQLPNT
ncbi:HAMP domain-containing sensor histidine kinase [Vibrio sp. RE88]|uniref:sensor histidine kinase n=1 Tax=Vibrio sp. RE88 TaxID=2607610 RepID=UPI0014933383|nr:HAMP domain-containing sensor histidine kinase [Vibrio sp. RE88]NOH61884.1 HAMP domain-containing histidine kinase [Vibrio sp. RE88]